MRLPWVGRDVPHAILDVGRGCDAGCVSCYNDRGEGFKGLDQLESDLKALRRRRRLQTVSLTGGEPTLHPDLARIVEMVSRTGIKPALLTHGQHLTPELVGELRRAGLCAVLLHIQPTQRRADIDADASSHDWRQLRSEKARLLYEHGIKAGLSWIAYRSRLDELADAMNEVLNSPHLDYLLVTGYRNFSRFQAVTGSIEQGLRAAPENGTTKEEDANEVSMEDLRRLVERLGLPAFGYVGSSRNSRQARWLTHLVAVTFAEDGCRRRVGVRPGGSDWFFSRLMRVVTGKYAFLFTPSCWQFRVQLVSNALTGGRLADNCRLIFESFAGHRLVDKHILLQEGPTLLANGEIEFCDNCPDAVWQDNALVPVCLADRMAPGQTKTQPWKRNTPHSEPCSG